jgi:outer membrane protein
MKNAALVLSSLAFIGVLILFGLHFSSNKNTGKPGSVGMSAQSGPAPAGRLAYVNVDSLEAHYEYLKTKKDEFGKRQSAMEAELQRSGQQLQNQAAAFQQKVQAGGMSQTEGEAQQRKLYQMQQSLETRRQALTEQFLKEQDAFNKEIHDRLDKFLEEYNKDKHYDFILSYTQGSNIMYADKRLDITRDVIKGMNETAINSATDTTSKK